MCGQKVSNLSFRSVSLKDFNQAISYAEKFHKGQVRKSLKKEPMISHCKNVGDILIKCGANKATVNAGILHDTIEDTIVTKKDLAKSFGQKVSHLVNCVTEKANIDDWVKRSQAYISKLKKSPVDAMCVSAADKIDNMCSITENVAQKYNIFANMQGAPEMQLSKFEGVYNVVKGKIPKKLENLYKETLDNFVKVLKENKYL